MENDLWAPKPCIYHCQSVKVLGDPDDDFHGEPIHIQFAHIKLALTLVDASWLAANIGRVSREVIRQQIATISTERFAAYLIAGGWVECEKRWREVVRLFNRPEKTKRLLQVRICPNDWSDFQEVMWKNLGVLGSHEGRAPETILSELRSRPGE